MALVNNFDDVVNLLGGENGVFFKLDERVDDFFFSDGLIVSCNSFFFV